VNYFFLAIFILSAIVALFVLIAILRVAVGNARFNSPAAAVFNIAVFAACTTLAIAAFPMAFPA
jgi:hypothetical protein